MLHSSSLLIDAFNVKLDEPLLLADTC
jgi:hypothetical protein